MKLIKFVLEIDGEKKREIFFRENLNIITSKKKSDESGNSVGKSTLGRVLDYLFDGPISPIYVDEEFQTKKKEIEQLFDKSEVYASLEYLGLDNSLSVIKRRLSIDSEKQSYILNEKLVNNHEYIFHIMNTIFNVSSIKPTIRKLAPKFLRTNQFKMTKTVKFDNARNSSSSDINTVFLYLFNFGDTEILTKIHKLKNSIKNYKKNITAFKSVISQDKITTSINNIEKEIKNLEKSLLSSEQGVDKLDIVSKINLIDDKQNILSEKIFELELKIKNIINTNEILKADEQNYLLDELSTIYQYASLKVESILKDYEQAIIFHNYLLNTKREFVSQGIEKLKENLERSNLEFSEFETQKKALFEELKSKKNIEELSDTVKEIGRLDKELISLTAIVVKKDELNTKLASKTAELDILASTLDGELVNVSIFEKKFVENFKLYTNDFYGITYNFRLNFDKDSGECNPEVDDVQSNNEGGLKRLEVVTFDLAYIKTVGDLQALRPNFVLHDSIDEIDINNIRKFFNVSISLKGQHFVSLLSDKLTIEDYSKYKDYIILELSQEDKFFRI